MKKICTIFGVLFLFNALNCSEYFQNRNSRSETKFTDQNWSYLDTLRQKYLGIDRFYSMKDSIILIEIGAFNSHHFYNINLSNSEYRLTSYSIDQKCNPILNPSMEKPDSSCFLLDNFKIGELLKKDKLKIIEKINRICKASKKTYGDVIDGISFEIKTNYLPKNLDIYLSNPKDSIFEELDNWLIQIGKK